MLPVAESMGCPNGSYVARTPMRAPALSAVRMLSPCRFAYDQLCCPDTGIDTLAPPGRDRSRSISVPALLSTPNCPPAANVYRIVVAPVGPAGSSVRATIRPVTSRW
jgi:hypothetical protein